MLAPRAHGRVALVATGTPADTSHGRVALVATENGADAALPRAALPLPNAALPRAALPQLPQRRHPSRNSVMTHLDNRAIMLYVTVVTGKRNAILADKAVQDCIVAAWKAAADWLVGRYVIMPDHIHFFCAPATYPPPDFHRWMKQWKAQVSRSFPIGLRAGRAYGRVALVATENGADTSHGRVALVATGTPADTAHGRVALVATGKGYGRDKRGPPEHGRDKRGPPKRGPPEHGLSRAALPNTASRARPDIWYNMQNFGSQ